MSERAAVGTQFRRRGLLPTRPIIESVQRGDTVDDFTLEDQHGQPVTLSSLLESGPLVLYFYVKAMTSG
jgi:cytochrome oxidase Cu insertion factor (SCO1/SenC/PrrC family)